MSGVVGGVDLLATSAGRGLLAPARAREAIQASTSTSRCPTRPGEMA